MALSGIAIVAVKYNNNDKRDYIISVKAGAFTSENEKNIDTLGMLVSWQKFQVIDFVTETPVKTRVFTATGEENNMLLGAEVEAYPENDPKYIRTKGNNSECDNLGELPTY